LGIAEAAGIALWPLAAGVVDVPVGAIKGKPEACGWTLAGCCCCCWGADIGCCAGLAAVCGCIGLCWGCAD